MEPRICLSIAVGEVDEAIRMIDLNRVWEPYMIEIRLDYLHTVGDLENLRKCTENPLVATYRISRQEGSQPRLDEKTIEVLSKACDAGFDYVDLDLTAASSNPIVERLRETGVKLIVSYHDFKETPSRSDFKRILGEELNFEPEICKIVGTAKSYSDNLAYLNFVSNVKGVKIVCFGMGVEGISSRILSPLFGGFFTYASPCENAQSAPGQLPIRTLRRIYDLMEVSR